MRTEEEINKEYAKAAIDLGDAVFKQACIIKRMHELDTEIRIVNQEPQRKKDETDSD